VAVRSKLGPAQPGGRGAARQGAVAPRCVPGSAIEPKLRACLQGIKEPLLPRRRGRADAIPRLGRRLDVAAKRVRSGRPGNGRCRRRRQFRPREQFAVKGGGHSYQGTSNAADSLLIWTRRMNAVTRDEVLTPGSFQNVHALSNAMLNYVAQHALRC
jgi:hypothetical protein